MNADQIIMDINERLANMDRRVERARSRKARALRAENQDHWMWTGICPECGRRSITAGRCLSCNWEATR